MATFSVQYSFVANTKARAAEVNTNFTNVLTILQGHHHDPNIYTNASPITNSGIAANAQIRATQLLFPITLSGLIDPSAIRNNFPAGSVPATAIPFFLTSKRFSAVEIDNALTYISRDSGGELQFTDSVNGTKRVSQLGSIKFGGDGSDGALTITSGTTTIDCANASQVIKNYSAISITGTGKLAFSNPHTNGTMVILRSQGAVTLTSSQAPMIDMSAMGAAGGTAGASGSGNGGDGSNPNFVLDSTSHQGIGGKTSDTGDGGVIYSNGNFYITSSASLYSHSLFVTPGAGGGGGQGGSAATGGAGGRGGGALIIECAGALNFTTTGGISVSGQNGSAGSNGAGTAGGGGGGGAAGMCVLLYNSAVATTGTITSAGGSGGSGGTGSGGGGTTVGNGGGGAGAYGSAGGSGGYGTNPGQNGNSAAGVGAGGGGGGASTGSSPGSGGSGGGDQSSVVAKNIYFA